MKFFRSLRPILLLSIGGLTAFGSRAPEEIYNINEIVGLTAEIGESSEVTFRRLDGTTSSCPVTLAVTVAGTVEGNGPTDGYFDEVSIHVSGEEGDTEQILFAGDSGPEDPEVLNPVYKTGTAEIRVVPGDTISLEYLTRNELWNGESWDAEITSVEVLPEGCGTADCSGGRGYVSNGCVEMVIDLGGSPEGGYALGALKLYVYSPTVAAYDPASLRLASAAFMGASEVGRPALLEVRDPTGNLWMPGRTVRQIVTPNTFFDIVVTEVGRSYEIRVYDISRKGALGQDQLYAVDGNPQSTRRTWRVENPAPSGDTSFANVLITEITSGNSRAYDFDWIAADNDWTMTRGTGDDRIRERRITATNGDLTTETVETYGYRDGTEYLVHSGSETRRDFPFGTVLVERSNGAGADALVTSYGYHESGPFEGLRRSVHYPDGSWEYYHSYDANGLVAEKVESYLGNPFTGTWPDNLNRSIEIVQSSSEIIPETTSSFEGFSAGLGQFQSISTSGAVSWSAQSSAARINGFLNPDSETWLLSDSFPLPAAARNASLEFRTDTHFIGPALQVFLVLDYADPSDLDTQSAQLIELTDAFTLSAGSWVDSGREFLPSEVYGRDVRIAFRYTTGSAGTDAAEWSVDSVQFSYESSAPTETNTTETIVRLAGNTISRSWRIRTTDLDDRRWPSQARVGSTVRTVQATDVTEADPTAPGNRITTRYYFPSDVFRQAYPQDLGAWPNRLRKVEYPDGEIELHEYEATPGGGIIHKRWRGLPNAGGDAVVHGTLTEEEENSFGHVIRSEDYYLAPGESPLLTDMWLATQVNDDGRPTEITYGDGTVVTRQYGCCGLQNETTREGLTMVYSHDSLGRVTRTETWNGSTMLSGVEETLDARDRVIARTLEGRDGGTIDTYEAAFLTNGDLAWERDALGRLIEHDTQRQSGGHTVRTTTLPDSALIARETRTWPDGRLHRESGLAVNDTETTYGFEADPDTTGNTLETRTTTFLDASGTPTGEFRTLASRPSGLLRLEHRPAADGSGTVTARTVLDTAGRTVESEDVHGVITRFEYPDPFTSIRTLDADQDGSLGAADTATRNRRIWASANGTTVQRQTVEEWNEVGAWELVSQSDRETIDVDADGMEAWQLTYGAETYTLESPLSGSLRTVTTTFPDGTGSISQLDGGRLDWTRRLDTSGSHLRTVTRSYDEFWRVGSVIDSIDGTTTWLYDDLGRITSETLPDPDPSDPADGPETRTTAYTLLANGNEQQVVTHPGTVTTTTVLDPQGRTVLRYGFGTWPEAWTYDPAGRQATLTTWQDFDTTSGTGLAGETVTRWEYNAAGLLVQKHYNDSPTTSEPGSLHAYTPGGLLLTRTLPRNGSDSQPIVVTYDYEDGETGEPHTARLIGVSYGTNTPNTDDVIYTWDNRGRLETVEDGSGRRRLNYETGQVVSDLYETGPLAGFGHSLSLDPANGYRPSGRFILSPSGTLRSESLAYDAFGRMDALTVDDDTVAYGFHHDTAFPTTTTVSRDGTASVSQGRVYDRRGRLDSIDASDGTATFFSAAQSFDAHGRVNRITLDSGAYWDYGYDSMGQVISGVKKDSVGTALPGYNFGYGFDSIGNRESATREATTEAYTPNFLNQITEIDHGGLLHLLGTADASASVLVDGAAATRSGDLFYGTIGGNNTFENFSILGTLTGAGDGGSDAVARFDREAYIPAGATSRTHDESGNLTEDAEWLYTWDAENRLVRMETRPSVVTAGVPHRRLSFEYDSQSRRIRKTVETWDGTAWQPDEDIRFLWNDWLLSAELEADTLEPIRSYTWGHDLAGTRDQTGGVGGLALVNHYKNGEVTAPLYTTNGNVRGYWEIDAAELVAEFEYGPFGELLKKTGEKAHKHPIRWSSKYEDDETGLVYYGFRYYTPEMGRWLSRDPIGEEGGMNLYGFVGNDGVNWVDLLGLSYYERQARGKLFDKIRKAFEKTEKVKNAVKKLLEVVEEMEEKFKKPDCSRSSHGDVVVGKGINEPYDITNLKISAYVAQEPLSRIILGLPTRPEDKIIEGAGDGKITGDVGFYPEWLCCCKNGGKEKEPVLNSVRVFVKTVEWDASFSISSRVFSLEFDEMERKFTLDVNFDESVTINESCN